MSTASFATSLTAVREACFLAFSEQVMVRRFPNRSSSHSCSHSCSRFAGSWPLLRSASKALREPSRSRKVSSICHQMCRPK